MRIPAILFLLLAGSPGLTAQVEKEIKPDIKHVTVYPDRAQVYHEVPLQVNPGTVIYRFSGLSPYIDPQSIRAAGYGEFIVMTVNHRNNYLENLEGTSDVEKIHRTIEELQTKIDDEKAAISILREKAEFLSANRALLLKETSTSPEQIKSIMDLFAATNEQVTLGILKRERQVKSYEEQITALNQQISARTGKQQLPSGEILVTVSSAKQGPGRMELRYVVSNAGWFPSYDIRVDDIKNPISISYKANVFQNTGADWKNAMISFSNATPSVTGDVPKLYPWFVDFYNFPQPVLRDKIVIRGVASGINEPASAPLMSEATGDLAVTPPPDVRKHTGETTLTFDLADPFTVAADGKMQTIEIQRLSAPAGYKYVTVPRQSSLAYLSANITGWAELDLLSGESALYFENSFVGKSFLDVNQLSDTLSVSLGPDNSILVKREKSRDFTGRRILGANKTETNSFKITVRNNKQTPVRITIKDQIPVSSNSSIEVTPEELSGGRLDRQTGFVEWEPDLKPGETLELVLTYTVKYPKDRNVILE